MIYTEFRKEDYLSSLSIKVFILQFMLILFLRSIYFLKLKI